MKVVLDNAQSGGPHIDILDDKEIIRTQIHFCQNDIVINEKSLKQFPRKDGIVIYYKRGR